MILNEPQFEKTCTGEFISAREAGAGRGDRIGAPASSPATESSVEEGRREFRRPNRDRRRGSEAVEFTLVLMPLLILVLTLVDTAWAVFAKACLQRAVRIGVRTGVTLTASQMASGACLTDTVKGVVQQNALGLLNGSSGLAKLQVRYFQTPAPDSTGAVTDVSTQASGNQWGNIMQVSVVNYSLVPLSPRLFPEDKSPLVITVRAADLIEPNSSPPCIGTAP